MRMLIRTSALLTIFLVAIAGAEAEGVGAVEGCGWSCFEMNKDACFDGWPSLGLCEEHIVDVCEMVLADYGPDCERACQVADGLCFEDESCEEPGELWLVCTFEVGDHL
jgi:hypothetical protein